MTHHNCTTPNCTSHENHPPRTFKPIEHTHNDTIKAEECPLCMHNSLNSIYAPLTLQQKEPINFLKLLWDNANIGAIYYEDSPNSIKASYLHVGPDTTDEDWLDIAAEIRGLDNERGLNVWFSTKGTNEIPTVNAKGGKVDPKWTRIRQGTASVSNCIFADFDNCDELPVFPLEPTGVVRTGSGFHPYWVFSEPIILDTPEQRTFANDLQRDFVDFVLVPLGADPAVKDMARMLRVPGTHNHKKNKDGSLKYGDENEVYIEFWNEEISYHPDQFEAALYPGRKARKTEEHNRKVVEKEARKKVLQKYGSSGVAAIEDKTIVGKLNYYSSVIDDAGKITDNHVAYHSYGIALGKAENALGYVPEHNEPEFLGHHSDPFPQRTISAGWQKALSAGYTFTDIFSDELGLTLILEQEQRTYESMTQIIDFEGERITLGYWSKNENGVKTSGFYTPSSPLSFFSAPPLAPHFSNICKEAEVAGIYRTVNGSPHARHIKCNDPDNCMGCRTDMYLKLKDNLQNMAHKMKITWSFVLMTDKNNQVNFSRRYKNIYGAPPEKYPVTLRNGQSASVLLMINQFESSISFDFKRSDILMAMLLGAKNEIGNTIPGIHKLSPSKVDLKKRQPRHIWDVLPQESRHDLADVCKVPEARLIDVDPEELNEWQTSQLSPRNSEEFISILEDELVMNHSFTISLSDTKETPYNPSDHYELAYNEIYADLEPVFWDWAANDGSHLTRTKPFLSKLVDRSRLNADIDSKVAMSAFNLSAKIEPGKQNVPLTLGERLNLAAKNRQQELIM